MSRALPLAALLLTGCLKAWEPAGPYACDLDGGCAGGLFCDDGVCCQPGGTPACPTLPVDGRCPSGAAPVLSYPDRDGDGVGDGDGGRLFCSRPLKERWVATAGDCNDSDPAIAPNATERCNGLDDNCNGELDEGTPRTNWFLDVDGDGFGSDTCAGCVVLACAQPHGFAARAGDCDPDAGDVFPGAPERCNNRDDNCNGQLDDPPFIDVENPGLDSGVFDCPTAALGVCAPGGLHCLYQPDAGRFEPRCVSRVAPSPDVCGDGLDNDCDGVADDAPGCGGPPNLLDVKGGRTGALALTLATAPTGSKLPARCLRHEPADGGMAWLNPIWVGNGPERHVWYVEAPGTDTWDLSRPGAKLLLDLTNSSVGGPASGNTIWDAGWFDSPVVTVCGQSDDQFRRWVPSTAQMMTGGPFAEEFPVAGVPAGWSVEVGTRPLDLSQVRRVEVVVSPTPAPPNSPYTFRITFRDAGLR